MGVGVWGGGVGGGGVGDLFIAANYITTWAAFALF